jgi:hypothetical protein
MMRPVPVPGFAGRAKIFIHSWRKDERLNRWTIDEEEITLKHFAQAFAYPNTVKELM